MPRKINLIGAYNENNLGDDLLYKIGVAWSENGTLEKLLSVNGIKPTNVRRVYFGGTQFFSFSKATLKWALYYIVKRSIIGLDKLFHLLRGAQSTALFVGIGPFRNGFAERLTKAQLQQCSLVILRDEESFAWAARHLPSTPKMLLRDPVFLDRLNLTLPKVDYDARGLCFILRDWPALRGTIEEQLVTIARDLRTSSSVVLTTFGNDPRTEVAAQEAGTGVPLIRYIDYGIDRYVDYLTACFGTCDVIITMRFHGAILALMAGRKVIIIDIDIKFKQLIKDFGELVSIISAGDLSSQNLLREINRLRSIPRYKERVAEIISSFGLVK